MEKIETIIERVEEALSNNWAVDAEDIEALINHIKENK